MASTICKSELTDIHKILHPTTPELVFYASNYRKFAENSHMLCHEIDTKYYKGVK